MVGRRIVLASASPRRHEILSRAGVAFTVVTSGVDETVTSYDDPADYSLQLAHRKAAAVARSERDALVIGSDTIVEIDGRILGKPRDETDAARMLRDLRGRTHRVTTGVVVVDAATGRTRGHAETTAVTMRDFSDDELAAYVASGEPFDKAGSYAIQGIGGALVERVDGPFDNVVGLPASVVTNLLRAFRDEVTTPG
ncbi:septum formation protein [Frankia sp. EI5c]|uniref:Maf family protein n=1 Tax=Frankia sp. EI5c TaxID=683316 RepID=UPI0007C2E978|nr:Maf family protein [Frankia sp. EI5c]OAA23257.1 septum formation protein [Frankia sp. EI5c]